MAEPDVSPSPSDKSWADALEEIHKDQLRQCWHHDQHLQPYLQQQWIKWTHVLRGSKNTHGVYLKFEHGPVWTTSLDWCWTFWVCVSHLLDTLLIATTVVQSPSQPSWFTHAVKDGYTLGLTVKASKKLKKKTTSAIFSNSSICIYVYVYMYIYICIYIYIYIWSS